ncbi:MAG: hypothetical protein R3B72_13560 [Polyangiaceae bacterium]
MEHLGHSIDRVDRRTLSVALGGGFLLVVLVATLLPRQITVVARPGWQLLDLASPP